MILDLSRSGLEVFGFLPYQVEAMRAVWRGRTCSRFVFVYLREKGYGISRPSIINFLRRMAREGVFLEEAEGGTQTRHWYTPSPKYPDEGAFVKNRVNHVLSRLEEEFPQCFLTEELI